HPGGGRALAPAAFDFRQVMTHDGVGPAGSRSVDAIPSRTLLGRHRGSARFATVALALTGVLALPAGALAAWTDAEDLSAAGHNAFMPQVGVDSAGNAVVVWDRSDGANNRVQ